MKSTGIVAPAVERETVLDTFEELRNNIVVVAGPSAVLPLNWGSILAAGSKRLAALG